MTGRVSKSGYLRKVSSVYDGFSVGRPLLKRWVVLQHYKSHRDNVIISRLICYDDKNQHNVSHEIDLADGTIIDVVEKDVGHLVNESAPARKRKPAGYGFELVHRNKNCNISFVASNDDIRREWMAIIRKKMKKSSKKELRFDLNNDVVSHETTTEVLRKDNRDLYLRIEKLEAMCSRLRQELARYCPSDFINNLLRSFSPPVKRVRSAKQAAKVPTSIQRSITPESQEVDTMCALSVESDECESASALDPRLPRMVSVSKLKTPRVSISSMTRTKSANEFENDDLSSAHSATIGDDETQLHKMNDICHRFQSVMHVDRLRKTLINDELVADSRFKLFSSAYSFTESAGLLTKKHLYLISAVNHQLWTEFAARSRIDQLIPTENDNDTKITVAIAKQLGHNLNLVDDEQINAAMQQQLVGQTKKQLKLDILLQEKHIQSLACWFPALHATLCNSALRAQQLKEVNRIVIVDFYNVSIIAEAERDAFIRSILHANQIAYDDHQRCGSDILITLQQYCTQSEIKSLNQRANAWIKQKRGSDAYRIKVVAHDDTIKVTTSVVLSADIRSFADLRTAPNDKCSLALTDKQDGAYMWCTFESLNICQEWCTHLNSVMSQSVKLKHSSSSDQKNAEQPARKRRLSNTSCFSEKIMNDFGAFDDECIVDDEQQEHFGFGVYLNYWQEGFANSVKPRHPTLKDELCNNEIAHISDSEYDKLYRDCVELLRTHKHRMLADDIGVNNKRFRIRKGTPITLNHLIALKLMTDFTDVQNTFKKTCRKKHANETMTQLVKRNAECAHWCRYIKEACTFYGKRLTKSAKSTILYTGLKQQLLFSSMKQHFECPISTTENWLAAQKFCDDNGVILKLKSANSRARYFDVSWLSAHKAEEERLIMGSSLEICDIYVNGNSIRKDFGKSVFSAISLFERLTNGQFITHDIEAERVLFDFLQKQFPDALPTYIADLFANLVKAMRTKHENGKLWLNKDEITKLQHEPLRNLFIDQKLFESRFQLDPRKPIRYVQQYEWQIDGDQLKHFNELHPRQYLSSDNEYQYESLMATINFNLQCCAKYSEASNKTGLFLDITKMQSNVRSVLLGYDIFCDAIGKKNYEHSILPQWMDKNKQHCGLQMFKCERFDAKTAPNESSSITWKIALKIIDVKYEKQKSF